MGIEKEATSANALVVLAHPERRSFNGQLPERCATVCRQEGVRASISDLYGEGFNPAEGPDHYPDRSDPVIFRPMAEQRHASESRRLPPDVAGALARLYAADLVVFQFPLWWYGPPAVLKGWFDRVFVYGETYSSHRRYDRGVFRGKDAILSVTTGSPQEVFQSGRDGAIDYYLWPIHFTLHYLGFTVWPTHVSYGISGDGAFEPGSHEFDGLRCTAERWSRRMRRVLHRRGPKPLQFNGWDDWGRDGRLLKGAPNRFPFRHA